MLKGATVRPRNLPKIPSHNPLPHCGAAVPTAGARLLPNAHVSANRIGAANRLCGHPVFSERAPCADWPSKGLFFTVCVVPLEGKEERGNATWPKTGGGGKFPLNTAVCHVCVYHSEWVCMWTLHYNQMRVGSYSMCALCLDEENHPCVLFVRVLCVFVSPFLGNRLFLAKQAARKSAVTSVTPTHRRRRHQHHHLYHLHPSSPSGREAKGNRYSTI